MRVFLFSVLTALLISGMHAKAYVLLDGDRGRVLYGENEEQFLQNASTTKILTCIVVLENCGPEEEVTVSSYAASMPKVHLGMKEGDTYTVEALLYSMMLESHNDSAMALAEHVGGDVKGFSEMLNKKAEEIGCRDTCFLTPNGLDAQWDESTHGTTARDLALIMSYCVWKSPKKQQFLEITQRSEYVVEKPGGARVVLQNKNMLLNPEEGFISGKTGYTGKAGYCYAAAYEKDGRRFTLALLGCGWPPDKTLKWKDTQKLITYGEEHTRLLILPDRKELEAKVPDIPIIQGAGNDLYDKVCLEPRIVFREENPMLLLKEEEQLGIYVATPKKMYAPVRAGDDMGKIVLVIDGNVLTEYPLVAGEDVKKRSFMHCLAILWTKYFLL